MLDATFNAVKSMVPTKWGLKFPQSKEYQERSFEYDETFNAAINREHDPSSANQRPPIGSETPEGPMADVIEKCLKLASFLHSDATALCKDLSPS
jgi:hypothetical protein